MNTMNYDKPTSKPVKCYSSDRKTRKGIAVKNLQELVEICRLKFGYTGTVKVVLEEDGMEVEEDAYFTTLPPNTKLMILNEEQNWTPASEVGASSHTSLSTVTENNPLSKEEMLGVISSLKDKCTAKRKAAYAMGSSSEKRNKISNSTVKLSPGWKHYIFNKGAYVQVRSRKDRPLPTTDMIFESNLDYDSCLHKMEDLYFTQGKSLKGKLSQMHTKLGSSRGELSREGFSPKAIYEENGNQKAKIYLLTKNKIPDLLALTGSESDEEEDDNNNVLPIIFPPKVSKPATVTTNSTMDQKVSITPTPSTSTFTVHADTSTVNMQLPNSYRICTVCVDREVDAVILPCVHSLCYTCALHFKENFQPCPMCRTMIADVKSIYFN